MTLCLFRNISKKYQNFNFVFDAVHNIVTEPPTQKLNPNGVIVGFCVGLSGHGNIVHGELHKVLPQAGFPRDIPP